MKQAYLKPTASFKSIKLNESIANKCWGWATDQKSNPTLFYDVWDRVDWPGHYTVIVSEVKDSNPSKGTGVGCNDATITFAFVGPGTMHSGLGDGGTYSGSQIAQILGGGNSGEPYHGVTTSLSGS